MIVGVTGGKGGTGKTVFAVNLAVALAKKGVKVRLIDCDVDCPSAHIVLGTELKSKQKVESFVPRIDASKCKRCGLCVEKCEQHSLFQVKGETPTFIDKMCNGCKVCALVCKHGAIVESNKIVGWTYNGKRFGVSIFSGELKPSEPLSEKVVDAVKKMGLKGEAEITIIDTSAGAHCNVVRALQGCEKAYLITEPTLLGAHDLKVISSVLKTMNIPGT
ncbi:MAG: P-loop NTPase, partial [Candidatus Micrarchaeota archaeon]